MVVHNKIKLTTEPFGDKNSEDFTIRCYLDDNQIGYLSCYYEHGRLYAFEVFVNHEYRRNKIATKMYNFAEEISGTHIYPHHENPYNPHSEDVSNDALAFWSNRRNL